MKKKKSYLTLREITLASLWSNYWYAISLIYHYRILKAQKIHIPTFCALKCTNWDCYFTSDPGGFLAGSTKSETEAKKIMG